MFRIVRALQIERDATLVARRSLPPEPVAVLLWAHIAKRVA